MPAYYNEIDGYAAQWLRNLIGTDLIAPGDVDERSIVEIDPAELAGYRQVHFFAGIGGWSYALQLAGWDGPCWTASCPCQPFSSAGQRKGVDDERDLWPALFRLIEACRPPVIFGEQVASSLVLGRSDDADMHTMWSGETLLRISEWLQREEIPSLQGLRPTEHERFAKDQAPSCSRQQGVARTEQGLGADLQRTRQGESQGFAAGDHISGGAGQGQQRTLCGDRHTVRSDGAPRLELPIVGSDRAWQGIYAREYARGDLCLQCNGECLGGADDIRGSCRHSGAETAELKRLISQINREAEEQYQLEWITRIRADLERCGYSFGASILPAAGSGAPHIRQRLFWVADAKIGRGWPDAGAIPSGQAARIRNPERQDQRGSFERNGHALDSGATSGLGNADDARPQGWDSRGNGADQWSAWSPSVALPCLDGKARRIESATFRLVDGLPWSLGSVRASVVEQITKEVLSHGKTTDSDPSKVVRDLWGTLLEKAEAMRTMGKRSLVREEAILLNILFVITKQGWPFAQSISCEGAEVTLRKLRVLWNDATPSRASSGRELDEQQSRQSPDPLHLLSSILARYAQKAWDEAYRTHAAALHPLVTRLPEGMGSDRPNEASPFRIIKDPKTGKSIGQAPSRVGMLRGYGNSIVPQVAAEFVRSFMEIAPGLYPR